MTTYQERLLRFNIAEKGLPRMKTMPNVLGDGRTRSQSFLAREGHDFPPTPAPSSSNVPTSSFPQ